MKKRCFWVSDDPIYIKYHDEEWGIPVHDDYKHFEFIVLESAQAGLSWITILKKRENYKKAYENFDFKKVALYDSQKIDMLLKDEGIVRNRKKIEASINNAKAFIKIREEFGTFDKYIWSFSNGEVVKSNFKSYHEIPTKTKLSDDISKDLKKRGFKFIGTTIIYSYLQAVGIVEDHEADCFKKV
ncbi:DNA-3-methyladenine glycosylase I [Acetoanaerobium pronyense]|uniref:DNA-3-methyladenine glycosylase I n=1 Tax=Acetoanaerobium pronyense TaxID=1482736 RepID=A0ABS4KG86_9FIRM|nr:DNA-3-methyladenine glycosylase I [Acetoanaerobium pronyense]MBP2026784.1 DNA-3-methyladenine glycosylase I [Acetoanaerobium pronyense]